MIGFIKFKRSLLLMIVGVIFSITATVVSAHEAPLMSIELDTNGDGQLETIELYADGNVAGSNYKKDLILLLKDTQGKILTGYVPSIKGGYAVDLQKASFLDKGEQLILSVDQGDAEKYKEHRIIDFSDHKVVKEIFNSVDNSGIKAEAKFLDNYQAKVVLDTRKITLIDLKSKKDFYEQRGLYSNSGQLRKMYQQPSISKIDSLVPISINEEKKKKFITLQHVNGLNADDTLGEISGVWEYSSASGWKVLNKKFYKNVVDITKSKFRRTYTERNWSVMPSKIRYNKSIVIYPVYTVAGHADIQKKVNQQINNIYQSYCKNLESDKSDLDYTMPFVSEKLVSLVFFGSQVGLEEKKSEKITFNVETKTGDNLSIDQVLNLKDADLLPVLKVLTKGSKIDFNKGIPQDWYYNGMNIVFCELSDKGEWLESVVAVSDLKKFIKKPEIFEKTD